MNQHARTLYAEPNERNSTMRHLLLIIPFLALGNPTFAQQTNDPVAFAETQYHDAAQAYLNGNNDQAEAMAERGLTADPGNRKLTDLLDLIRQQQNQRPSESENRNADNQESPPDDHQEEGEFPPQEQPNPPQEDSTTEPQDQNGTSGTPAPPSSAESQRNGHMTREEAARLLDAVGAEERLLLEKIRRTPTRNPEKDW